MGALSFCVVRCAGPHWSLCASNLSPSFPSPLSPPLLSSLPASPSVSSTLMRLSSAAAKHNTHLTCYTIMCVCECVLHVCDVCCMCVLCVPCVCVLLTQLARAVAEAEAVAGVQWHKQRSLYVYTHSHTHHTHTLHTRTSQTT